MGDLRARRRHERQTVRVRRSSASPSRSHAPRFFFLSFFLASPARPGAQDKLDGCRTDDVLRRRAQGARRRARAPRHRRARERHRRPLVGVPLRRSPPPQKLARRLPSTPRRTPVHEGGDGDIRCCLAPRFLFLFSSSVCLSSCRYRTLFFEHARDDPYPSLSLSSPFPFPSSHLLAPLRITRHAYDSQRKRQRLARHFLSFTFLSLFFPSSRRRRRARPTMDTNPCVDSLYTPRTYYPSCSRYPHTPLPPHTHMPVVLSLSYPCPIPVLSLSYPVLFLSLSRPCPCPVPSCHIRILPSFSSRLDCAPVLLLTVSKQALGGYVHAWIGDSDSVCSNVHTHNAHVARQLFCCHRLTICCRHLRESVCLPASFCSMLE